MNILMATWSDWANWLKPSAGFATLQWSLLLALASLVGHLVQRYSGLPKVLGYSLVGTLAGLAGFGGAGWPLQGIGLFLLELGVAVVLFEAGGRLALRWFRLAAALIRAKLFVVGFVMRGQFILRRLIVMTFGAGRTAHI